MRLQAAQAALEDAEQERPPSPQAINNGQSNGKGGIASLLAALASPYAEDGKEKKEEHKRPINPANAGSTLFDKVRGLRQSHGRASVLL